MQIVNDKHFLTFVYENKEKCKQNKTGLKICKKSLVYMLGDKTANHDNFMQPMLIAYSSCYY